MALHEDGNDINGNDSNKQQSITLIFFSPLVVVQIGNLSFTKQE